VGFDPRGVARSHPVLCSLDLLSAAPSPVPTNQAEFDRLVRYNRDLGNDCRRHTGPLIDHVDTSSVVKDLDRLREAVGDAQLSYYGVSYGSFLGVTYANLFPGNVRALVVDGVLDPIAWTTGRGSEGSTVPFSVRLHSDLGAQATLEEFLRLCEAGADRCAFAPDAAGRWEALAERLRQAPIAIVDPETGETFDYNYSFLIGDTLGALYDSAAWPDLAAFLADLESQASATTLGASLARLHAEQSLISPRGSGGYPNFLETLPGVACADADDPHDYAAWSVAGAAADLTSTFGRIWTWISSICAEWPGADEDRYAGPFTATTAHPVLVVGNTFDPATRYEGAVTVHDLLPSSALLTVNGWGHTSLFLSACADGVIAGYLVDLATPATGAGCDQDVVPFA